MQSSSTAATLETAVDVFLASHDGGSEDIAVLSRVTRKLHMHVLKLASAGVARNEHSLAGARSAGAWLGALAEAPERVAARQLMAYRSAASHPAVLELARSGAISLDKADVLVRASKESPAVADVLMPHVRSDSFEAFRQRANDAASEGENAEKRRKRLRTSQYVSVSRDVDNMVVGSFRLLPELAAPWLCKWKEVERRALASNSGLAEPAPGPMVRAEAFCSMLASSGGTTRSSVNYHVRLEDWQQGWPTPPDRCHLAGVGSVSATALQALEDHPVLRLLITERNKLLWYSEAKYRPDGPLPDFVKRATRAAGFDSCAIDGCVEPIDEIDHVLARTLGGDNELSNLQGLCAAHHRAKTKKDAPWTEGAIYRPPDPDEKTLADTG